MGDFVQQGLQILENINAGIDKKSDYDNFMKKVKDVANASELKEIKETITQRRRDAEGK